MIKMILILILLVSNYSTAQIEINKVDGNFISNCYKLPKRHSVQTHLSFKESKCNVSSTLFADNECKTKNLKIQYDVTYEIGSSLGNGNKFNFTPDNVYLTILNPDVVLHYNKNFEAGCEMSNWKLNETKDVSGKVCAGNKMFERNIKIFDLFKMYNNILFFASFTSANGASDENLRPLKLNQDIYFTKEQ